MASAIITVRTDLTTKRAAQKTAALLGLDLSSVINRQLHEFIEKREITYREPLIPNKKTAASLRQAEAEYRRGDSYHFNSSEAAMESLRKIANR